MMFNCVHHVRILVHDADEMVQYMAQTFAMTPVKVQVYESRGMKNAIYKPTVCLDVMSLMTSSCGYYRSKSEPRVAQ
jgi:hypothetical protein